MDREANVVLLNGNLMPILFAQSICGWFCAKRVGWLWWDGVDW